MPLPTSQLRPSLLRLRLEQDKQQRKIQQIEQQKTALFNQGVQQTSPALQKALARRILTLERLSTLYQKSLAVTQRQVRLVVALLYAQEMADNLQDGALQAVDWEDVLRGIHNLQTQQQVQLEQVDSILEILESRRPKPAPAERPAAKPAPAERPAPRHKPLSKPRPVPVPAPPTPEERGEIAVAVHVPDGDGLKLADGRRVRYIGIDAPEMRTWDDRTEPWAEEARDLNRQLVEGQFVRLVRDQSETDQYGRLLRYVFVGKTFVNAELVKAGLAYTINIPPDTAQLDELEKVEESARRARRGVWKK